MKVRLRLIIAVKSDPFQMYALARWVLTMVLCILSVSLPAQTWQRVIDFMPDLPGNIEEPFEILPAADGGYLVIISNGFLVKLDADGDTLWSKVLPPPLGYLFDAKTGPNGEAYLLVSADSISNRLITLNNSGAVVASLTVEKNYEDFCSTPDGFVLATTDFTPAPDSMFQMLRINLAGDTLWYHEYETPDLLWYAYDIIQAMDGGFLVSFFELHTDGVKHQRLVKTDTNGSVLWTSNAPTIEYSSPDWGQILEEPDGSFVLMDRISLSGAAYYIRLSATGQVLQEQKNYTVYAPRDFALSPDGGFWSIGTDVFNGLSRIYIHKLRHDFTIEWKRFFAPSVFGAFAGGIVHTGENAYTILGKLGGNDYPFVFHPDSLGNLQLNLLQGQLRHDLDEDCIVETGEPGLGNWIVSAGIFYTLTDSAGNFELYTGPGSTVVNVYPPMVYWAVCPGADTVTFAQTGDTAYLEIPVYTTAECPYTEINVSTAAFRPCFESILNIQYCNIGTAAADSASALVVLPAEIDFVSASIPVLLQSGDSLWFDLDTLDIGECGHFDLTVLVECDTTILGQTLCVEARIFPDTFCLPAFNWSGAEVAVSAQCIGNQEVKLTISNIGIAPNASLLDYLIVEDQVVLYQGLFQLNPDSVLSFTLPATGSFWRISAEQEPNFPVPSTPAAWVEGCGGTQDSSFVNNYYLNDAASSVDVECRVVTSSFDPNDKQAFPEGYAAEHFIEPETEITYLIRFQNTGTDTAFTVILRDTLDPWLDPSSVRPGAASHPYTFDITGPGILKIWFKNILLPDSNTNEAASHGYFQYRVKQKPDVPLGTRIFNSAAIYFDFNAPVITNRTFHTVGRNFYTVSISDVTGQEGVRMSVAPNPFSETAWLKIENAQAGDFTLRIFDTYGRLMRSEKFEGPEMLFHRNGLPQGIYFFDIQQHGRQVVAGKMVAQ